MSRVNALFMDEQDKAMKYYIATHPGATEEDAWYALYDQGQPEPNPTEQET